MAPQLYESILGGWPLIRSASATSRLITRSNSLLCAGSEEVFNSEAIASSFRCTSAKSSLGIWAQNLSNGITAWKQTALLDVLDRLILSLGMRFVAPTEA